MSDERVERTLKPMLSACLAEAVHLALIDSILPEADPNGDTFERRNGVWTEEEKQAMEADIYAIPGELLAKMDPGALCQNVACRLLGYGGWELPTRDGAMYTGNATTAEVFEASFERPDRDHAAEVLFDVTKALRESEDNPTGEVGDEH